MVAAGHGCFRLFGAAAFLAVFAAAVGGRLTVAAFLAAARCSFIVLHAALRIRAAARRHILSGTAAFTSFSMLGVTRAHLCICGIG